MTEPVSFRPATAGDSRACFAIMRGALHDLMQRTGQLEADAPALGLDERWARGEGLFGHLAQTCSQWWLAEGPDGRPVGYARSIEPDATVELTEFFVSAGARGSGVGRGLLERAFAPGAGRHRCIIATTAPAAIALYLRFGIVHQTTGVDIVGTPRALALPAGYEAAPATLEDVLAIEAALLGHSRPKEVAFMLADAAATRRTRRRLCLRTERERLRRPRRRTRSRRHVGDRSPDRLAPRCHLRQDRRVSSLRDYEEWHARYDDRDSDLSWRLRTVRRFIEDALVRHQGPMRILSSCAGDGRDVLGGVLSDRDDVNRITVTLLEVHPRIANQARAAAAGLPVAGVEVRAVDAGDTDAYAGAVPAELVLMVGIFGNICDADLRRTIATTPQFCQPDGTPLWSRARERGDRNAEVRASLPIR